MSSIPPPARRSTPPPLLELPSAAGDSRLFFSIEGAPPQSCATRAWASGIAFDTTVAGSVRVVGPHGLDLSLGESTVALRYVLPPGLDLTPLTGQWLSVRLEEHFEAGRWTRHLEIRDVQGRPVMVARDGRLPRDGAVLGLTVRLALEGEDRRLAIGLPPQLQRVAVGVPHRMRTEGASMELVALRLGPEDAALVLVAR